MSDRDRHPTGAGRVDRATVPSATNGVDEVPLKQILFVESYPQSLYGQQETLLGLLERCAGRGIAPMVATPMDGCFVEALRGRGFDVAIVTQPGRLAQYGGALYREGLRERCRSFAQAAAYLQRVRRWLRSRSFDAVFCNDMRALLTFGVAARSLALPVLIWDKLDKPHGWLDHLQLPLVNRNLVISQAVTAKYPAWQRRWLHSRIRCVFDGVAMLPSDHPPAKPLPAVPPGAVVIAIVGTVTPRKGHDLLLAAFASARERLPNLQLWVVGDALDDADRGWRQGLAEDSEGVAWLGFRDDVPAIMRRIDILASPSRHEGMGRVNVEAMVAGKPVVGSAGTGIAEVVVDGETGLLVDPTDRVAFADCLVRLATDPPLRARMGAAARSRAAAAFDQERQLDKVLDELRAIADAA